MLNPSGGAMDPQMIQAMLQMGGNDSAQMQQLKRQQKMADMLRQQAMQMPQAQQMGRVSSAPGIANVAANAYGLYQANKMQGGIDQGMQQQQQQQTDTKTKYLDALMMALRRNPPQAGQSMLPPNGMEDQ